MDRKYCIFNYNKECTNCGECDACDLNKNKKCNNCGKCLELQGVDMKGVTIDEIVEDKEEVQEVQEELKKEFDLIENKSQSFKNDHTEVFDELLDSELDYKFENEDINFTDDDVELIDDIEGLRDILDDDKNFEDIAYEEFPGFIRLKKNYKN